jgi:electron transfer flavoprotein alpha subunit
MSVLVYTENWDGRFKKLSYELVSYANEIARKLNTTTTAVTIGAVSEEELKKLGNYGASKVFSVCNSKIKTLENAAFTSIIAQVAEKEGSKIIILSNGNSGKALAPRLSARLKAGYVSAVVALPSSFDPFIIRKKVFTGKAFANIAIKSDIKILTLSQNSFELIETANSISVNSFDAVLNDKDFSVQLEEIQKFTGTVLLTDAEIVVSGGRGLKGPENWGPIIELAELLGAGTACTRPVSDEGWRPHTEHVGQTGKIIAPNLYFALGISGAIQHVAGVSSSKYIVAVNKDKDAPIFEVANYGIIGDVQKVLPDLIQAIKEAKAE